MLFNSIAFIVFFLILITIYYSIKHKYRWIILLIGSYYFYMSWNVKYIFLIIFSTFVDYFCGILIYKYIRVDKKKLAKTFLVLSLITNLGLLFIFKYFNFFSKSFSDLLTSYAIPFTPIVLDILLPVGISFYTFQTLSYSIDIYRKRLTPEKHFGLFAVYVSFFPQLVAGPIERAKNLLPQFREKHYFNYNNTIDGLKQVIIGFFKKVVIADNLSIIVNQVYNNQASYDSISLIIATIFFGIQIYCDFSGYTDIAIGISRMLGFNLMKNFNLPYFSKNVKEFWKRWHISLSSWFKDYVYFSLGGSRAGIYRTLINLFIVFLISGLWHGANWTFVIWGALNGIYIIINTLYLFKIKNKFQKIISIITTFIFINFSWIFFRANNLSDAFSIVKKIFSFNYDINKFFTLDSYLIYLGFFLIIILFIYENFLYKNDFEKYNSKQIWKNYTFYILVIFLTFVLGNFGEQQFIYFQF